MATSIIVLPKNTWVKVLTNVTYYGSVHIVNLSVDPTAYYVALVPTGDPAPVSVFAGGIVFEDSFSPSNSVASDYYVKATDQDGQVVVLT